MHRPNIIINELNELIIYSQIDFFRGIVEVNGIHVDLSA